MGNGFVRKGADLSVLKGTDLDIDKGADLDIDKGADLGVLATSVDLALQPLEAILGRLIYETTPPRANTKEERQARLQHFASDNGGKGLDDVLADIRGYVDELRTCVTELRAGCRKDGMQAVQGSQRGVTIQLVIR